MNFFILCYMLYYFFIRLFCYFLNNNFHLFFILCICKIYVRTWQIGHYSCSSTWRSLHSWWRHSSWSIYNWRLLFLNGSWLDRRLRWFLCSWWFRFWWYFSFYKIFKWKCTIWKLLSCFLESFSLQSCHYRLSFWFVVLGSWFWNFYQLDIKFTYSIFKHFC